MVEYPVEACATCGVPRPINEMRQVEIERLVGRDYGRSSGQRRGNSHSFSSGRNGAYRDRNSNSSATSSRSSVRDHTRMERVWVCLGCMAPRSYGWFQKALIGWGIGALLLYAAGDWLVKDGWPKVIAAAGSKITSSDRATGSGPERESATSKHFTSSEAASTAPSTPEVAEPPRERAKPKVIFAKPNAVVQTLPQGNSLPYLKCSATITEHCSE